MNTDKTGIMNAKKNIDSALSTLFRIINRPKIKESELQDDFWQDENVRFEREVNRIVMEAEMLKAQVWRHIQ